MRAASLAPLLAALAAAHCTAATPKPEATADTDAGRDFGKRDVDLPTAPVLGLRHQHFPIRKYGALSEGRFHPSRSIYGDKSGEYKTENAVNLFKEVHDGVVNVLSKPFMATKISMPSYIVKPAHERRRSHLSSEVVRDSSSFRVRVRRSPQSVDIPVPGTGLSFCKNDYCVSFDLEFIPTPRGVQWPPADDFDPNDLLPVESVPKLPPPPPPSEGEN